jgi:type IV pilus assembly protein PilQ
MRGIRSTKSRILIIFFFLTFCSMTFCAAQEKDDLISGPGTEKFSLNLDKSDILDVFKIISAKSGMNIIATPEVRGTVTLNLVDVTWDKALEVILEINNLGYEKKGNIIIIAPIKSIDSFNERNTALITEVFTLKYLDAQLTQQTIIQLLSPQGKTAILQTKNEAGWEFAGGKGESFGKQKRVSDTDTATRSNVLIVTDIPRVIDKVREIIKKIDVRPAQVLISTKIIEVSKDALKDMGIDWGTGSTGAESGGAVTSNPISQNGNVTSSVGGNSIGSAITPNGFTGIGGTTGTAVSSTFPFNVGSQVVFKKLTGTQFEVIGHALEQNSKTNTLSSPQILALNNQEATILVGTKYPILQSNITGAGSVGVTTVTLDYYQDIGVQLKVIPQVGIGGDISMVIHPAVTSYTDTVGTNQYPIILTREAETRVVMKDGETIVIGGLLIDEKTKSTSGVPILMDLPFVGKFFKRDTVSTNKLDLLIFITARVVKEEDSSAEEINRSERLLER